MYFIIKCALSGFLVALISEVSRRHTLAGSILASLPITSILAMIWLYRDTQSLDKVSELSTGIALIVLPSIVFFILHSALVTRSHLGFYWALIASCAGMTVTYTIYVWVLRLFGINI